MTNSTYRRPNDFLWAAFIVIGFGLGLGLVLLVAHQDQAPEGELTSEADAAIAQGDRAVRDAAGDYDQARVLYVKALDLLRGMPGNLDEQRAAVQIKIIHTYILESNYEKARERLKMLRELFPDARPAELAALEQEIAAGLRNTVDAPRQDNRENDAPPPPRR